MSDAHLTEYITRALDNIAQAPHGSRGLDADVMAALGFVVARESTSWRAIAWKYQDPNEHPRRWHRLPHVTTSSNAIEERIPTGWGWRVDYLPAPTPAGYCAAMKIPRPGMSPWHLYSETVPTSPLALCQAMLRGLLHIRTGEPR